MRHPLSPIVRIVESCVNLVIRTRQKRRDQLLHRCFVSICVILVGEQLVLLVLEFRRQGIMALQRSTTSPSRCYYEGWIGARCCEVGGHVLCHTRLPMSCRNLDWLDDTNIIIRTEIICLINVDWCQSGHALYLLLQILGFILQVHYCLDTHIFHCSF